MGTRSSSRTVKDGAGENKYIERWEDGIEKWPSIVCRVCHMRCAAQRMCERPHSGRHITTQTYMDSGGSDSERLLPGFLAEATAAAAAAGVDEDETVAPDPPGDGLENVCNSSSRESSAFSARGSVF